MNRLLLCIGLAAVLPAFTGCALLGSGAAPSQPTLTGIKAENAAWRDEIHRSPRGGSPTFGPLSRAEDAVNAAKAQSHVNEFDAQSLTQADQALAQAQSGWQAIANNKKRSDNDLARVAADSHRAQRLAQIAQYTAQREIGLNRLKQVRSRQRQRMQRQKRAQRRAMLRHGNIGGQGSSASLVGRRVVPDMLGRLQFQPGTARLTQASHSVIARLAKLLAAHSNRGVAIFGFASSQTPPKGQLKAFVNANPKLKKQHPSHDQQVAAYHQGLSYARARDVAELLVRAGVDSSRIGARAMGTSHPIASNDTAAGRKKNERAEAIIVPLKKNGG